MRSTSGTGTSAIVRLELTLENFEKTHTMADET